VTSRSEPIFAIGEGHTPRGDDDRSGLKLGYITTRGELNEAGQDDILRAQRTFVCVAEGLRSLALNILLS
jgi:hypothetical protein